MHGSSRDDYELSLFWICRRGCWHHPGFGRGVERFLILLFELVDILCQVPGCSEGAPLLPEGFILRSFLEFGSPRNSLLKFAFLHDSLRWTLVFPNFCVMHRRLRELDCVIRSQLSIFPQSRISRWAFLGHTTQLNSLFQQGHRSFSATFL